MIASDYLQSLFRKIRGQSRFMGMSSFLIHFLGLVPAVFVLMVYQRYLSHGLDGTLYTLASAAILSVILELLLRRIRFIFAVSASVILERELRQSVDNVLLNGRLADLQAYDKNPAVKAADELGRVTRAFQPQKFLHLIDAPFAVLFLLMLFLISPILAAIALAASIATVFISMRMAAKAHEHQRVNKEINRAASQYQASLSNLETVRVTGASGWLAGKLDAANAEIRVGRMNMGRDQDRLMTMVNSLAALTSVGLISVGATLVFAQELDFGSLIACNILAARAIRLVSKPAEGITDFVAAKDAFNDLHVFLQIPCEQEKGTTLSDYKGALDFHDLSFKYDGQPSVLFEHLTINIEPGKLVTVFGGNGAGKSTLAKMIVGLLEPIRGAILVDGVDLRQCQANWWRHQVIYMPQEPHFLNATLRENLSLLKPDTSDKDLLALLEDTNLLEFVDRHPQGLDMQLMQNGGNLPVGIRRRLALVRGLVGGGNLLILDEPFEGLDARGIQAVQKVFQEKHRAGATIIWLTQDVSRMTNAIGPVINLNTKPEPSVKMSKSTVKNTSAVKVAL